MTKPKATRGAVGWWADETVPDLSGALPATVDIEQFSTWLGPMLAQYRAAMATRAATPSRNELVGELRECVEKIDMARSALHDLSPWARGALGSISHAGANWPELARRLISDIDIARSLLATAAAALAAPAPKRGRKNAAARDALLAAIVAKLRASPMRAADAGHAADLILVRLGIVSPEDADSIKRAVRRGQKKP